VLVANQLIRSGADDNPAESKDFIEVEGGFTLYLGGDENLHQSKLTASKGTLDEASLRLVAENDVVLQNDVGDRLETEYLVWSEDSNRVYTNRAVAIYTEDGVLYGRGLESDGRFERYQILQPTGEMNLPDLH
jgi:LPS export ABC transporter protein LptC